MCDFLCAEYRTLSSLSDVSVSELEATELVSSISLSLAPLGHVMSAWRSLFMLYSCGLFGDSGAVSVVSIFSAGLGLGFFPFFLFLAIYTSDQFVLY